MILYTLKQLDTNSLKNERIIFSELYV